jgi:hypothetical protein
MHIYLIPAGSRRYELYCESDFGPPEQDPDSHPGWRSALSRRFYAGLIYLESYRRQRLSRASDVPRTGARRMRDQALGWVAERVAGQRLLWILRSHSAATAHHPDDCPAEAADRVVRTELRGDGRRHLVWMVVDALIYLVSVPLTPIPGPNVLALYFSFRAIGHFLSWMGARHGLRRVQWQFVASAPLTDLRRLGTLKKEGREALARDVSARLGLRHLDIFLERMVLARP